MEKIDIRQGTQMVGASWQIRMVPTNTNSLVPTDRVHDFLESSGLSQAIMLDAVAVGLRRKLTAEGAVTCVRSNGQLRLRALLARRWDCSSSERIESRIIGDILAMNPYARINGVQLRKHGRYVEAEIGVT